jgi:hypothetical protein
MHATCCSFLGENIVGVELHVVGQTGVAEGPAAPVPEVVGGVIEFVGT